MQNFKKDCEATIKKYNKIKDNCYKNLNKLGNCEAENHLKEMYLNLINDCDKSINDVQEMYFLMNK